MDNALLFSQIFDFDDTSYVLNGKKFEASALLPANIKSLGVRAYSYEGRWIFFPWANDDAGWEKTVKNTTRVFNEFLPSIGLQSQQFERVDLTVTRGDKSVVVPVMITDGLQKLATDARSVFYGTQLQQGTNPHKTIEFDTKAHDLVDKVKNINDAKKILKNLLIQFVTCFTFGLPVEINEAGTAVLQFKFPEEKTSLPSMGFFFTGSTLIDSHGIPSIHTFEVLKSAFSDFISKIAVSIAYIGIEPERRFWQNLNSIEVEIQKNLMAALDDELLKEAYSITKITAASYLKNYIKTQEFKNITSGKNDNWNKEKIFEYIRSAIPTGDRQLVEDLIALHGNFENLDIRLQFLCIKSATEHSEHKVASIFRKMVANKLKETFKTKYKNKLEQDKKAWCGLYAFFATSHVNVDNMTFQEIVQHGQGKYGKGTGARTLAVMVEMGILTKNKELNGLYDCIFASEDTNALTNSALQNA